MLRKNKLTILIILLMILVIIAVIWISNERVKSIETKMGTTSFHTYTHESLKT